MGLISPYILNDAAKENIRKYKYKGSDSSLFYQMVVSPTCDRIVTLFPKTLA